MVTIHNDVLKHTGFIHKQNYRYYSFKYTEPCITNQRRIT